MNAEEFAVKQNYFQLTLAQRDFVREQYENEAKRRVTKTEFEKLIKEKTNFLALMQGEHLLAYLIYAAHGPNCNVKMLWGRKSKAFVKAHKTSPAMHLLKLTKERGFAKITTRTLNENSRPFIRRNSSRGKLNYLGIRRKQRHNLTV